MRNLLSLVSLVLLPTVLLGATIEVPGIQPTIQAGINAAVNGDTILVAPGIYGGDGNRDITFAGKAAVLISAKGRDSTIILCSGTLLEPHRAFIFENGEDTNTVVSGFTIGGGYQENGGAIACDGASPKIVNCRMEGNSAGSLGGAVYCTALCTPILEDIEFLWNVSVYSAGLQCRMSANAIVRGCRFDGNTAIHGAAVAIYSASPQFIGCIFSRNTVSQSGGAVFIQDNSSPIFEECTFYGNTGSSGSNVFAQERFASVTSPSFDACLIAFGGGSEAVFVSGATPILTCSNIYGVNGGDWTNEISNQLGVDGNISEDPRFCDTSAADFDLFSNSPCLAGNNSCAKLMGASGLGCSEFCCLGIRGNVDSDSLDTIDISDLVYLVAWSFRFGPEPVCPEEADVNGDGQFDIRDVVYLVVYMFFEGPAPVVCPGK